MASLIETLKAASPHSLKQVWIDEAQLESEKISPWVELPLWIPSSDTTHSGFMLCDTNKAHAHGLRCRPIADTVRDTASWLRQRETAGTWQHVLTGERERALLDACRKSV
jgi:2'-hydroxyisoflavone reductase